MAITLAVALSILSGVNTKLTETKEAEIILQVAEEYNLTDRETRLLLAIRRVENGRPEIAFGVGSDDPNHPARRYGDAEPEKSLRLQAQWAAGTITRRYRGSTLMIFAARWCPPNADNWAKMVKERMDRG